MELGIYTFGDLVTDSVTGLAISPKQRMDYDALFAEKLGLLMALNESERVTWSGKFRPALHAAAVMLRPF